MNRISVASSNIKSIGHDPETKTLEVEFSNGGLYQYDGVDAEAHAALVNAPSVGSHFAAHIRGKYRHAKVPNFDDQ